MKNTFLILFLLLISQAYSQKKVNYGAKAGGIFSGFHTNTSANTSNFGFNLGAIANLELTKNLNLQSELLLSKKGGDIIMGGIGSLNINLMYIDIPVNIQYSFLKKLSFDAGPQINFLINSKGKFYNSFDSSNQEVEITDTNSIDFGVNGGLTYSINDKLKIQARYFYGLSKVFKNNRYKNSAVSLSLLYFFK